MSKAWVQTWELESIFPNGSESEAFASYLDALDADLKRYAQSVVGGVSWKDRVLEGLRLLSMFYHAGAFVRCLIVQDVRDEKARRLYGRLEQMQARLEAQVTQLDQQLAQLPDGEWADLLADDDLGKRKFSLDERRQRARQKLSAPEEALVGGLAVDGYHAWGNLYETLIGRMTIPVERDGQVVSLSIGQAQNALQDASREVRAAMAEKWEAAFAEQEELFAAVLNHLAGFRLQLYDARGWSSVLQEPLELNRMSERTLQVMWEVIERNKGPLLDYMARKADLLGVDNLHWYDLNAPLGSAALVRSFEEGATFLIEHFRRFSPDMAAFAEQAFEKRWIEAEDRPGKGRGAFCIPFPECGESRVFLTYNGTAGTVATLAHELGHAYHFYVMREQGVEAMDIAMSVAETASMFAEMIVSDAAARQAQSDEERLALLDQKLRRAVTFFMNIHTRFLFEKRFYEERRLGLVSSERLNQLMLEAWEEGHAGALASYSPHFWAWQQHFALTQLPFYNYPYTFGYLFSTGVYARGLDEGPSFAQKYEDLLRDTSRMTTEELAARHLGVDLTEPEFWQRAVDEVVKTAREFVELADRVLGERLQRP